MGKHDSEHPLSALKLMPNRSVTSTGLLSPPLMGSSSSRLASRASSVRSMGAIVLRVRLISGDSMDVTYEDRDAGSEGEVIDHVVSTLSEASGVLHCRHGERLVVLYARGVAAVEVAPRGAVL
jgi:hypothetical protein